VSTLRSAPQYKIVSEAILRHIPERVVHLRLPGLCRVTTFATTISLL